MEFSNEQLIEGHTAVAHAHAVWTDCGSRDFLFYKVFRTISLLAFLMCRVYAASENLHIFHIFLCDPLEADRF